MNCGRSRARCVSPCQAGASEAGCTRSLGLVVARSEGATIRLHGTSTMAWIVTKRSRISLTTDQLSCFNAGTEAVLSWWFRCNIMHPKLDNDGPCQEASLVPRVGLICAPDGLDEESALDFHIKVISADQVSFFARRVFVNVRWFLKCVNSAQCALCFILCTRC